MLNHIRTPQFFSTWLEVSLRLQICTSQILPKQCAQIGWAKQQVEKGSLSDDVAIVVLMNTRTPRFFSTSLEVSLRLQSVQAKTSHSPNTLHHHSRGQTDSGTNDLPKKMTFARMLETRRRMAREGKRAWYSFVIIKRM